ncbi:M15 family metallopeptidase [Parathermosynechococcus lividus]
MDQDIPIAERLQTDSAVRLQKQPLYKRWAIASIIGLGCMAGGVWFFSRSTEPSAVAEAVGNPIAAPTENLLGHLPYEEAPLSELVPVSADGQIQLRRAAAERFRAMVTAAQQEGIVLVPLSGFRSKQDQDYLFFQVKEQRGQRTSERALVSAPPGYSEHHTGYAIDIGDASQPDTHLRVAFEQTPAFQWLAVNAARFSFELSFPEGNSQGVSYEPWHWRFVGDRHSLQTFYKARQLNVRSAE